jgi:hypothetical protein
MGEPRGRLETGCIRCRGIGDCRFRDSAFRAPLKSGSAYELPIDQGADHRSTVTLIGRTTFARLQKKGRRLREFKFLGESLHQSFQNVRKPLERALEGCLRDQLIGAGNVRMQNSPGWSFEPAFVFDG